MFWAGGKSWVRRATRTREHEEISSYIFRNRMFQVLMEHGPLRYTGGWWRNAVLRDHQRRSTSSQGRGGVFRSLASGTMQLGLTLRVGYSSSSAGTLTHSPGRARGLSYTSSLGPGKHAFMIRKAPREGRLCLDEAF